MLRIADKNSVIRATVTRLIGGLKHQQDAQVSNTKAVKKAATTMRKQHGSD